MDTYDPELTPYVILISRVMKDAPAEQLSDVNTIMLRRQIGADVWAGDSRAEELPGEPGPPWQDVNISRFKLSADVYSSYQRQLYVVRVDGPWGRNIANLFFGSGERAERIKALEALLPKTEGINIRLNQESDAPFAALLVYDSRDLLKQRSDSETSSGEMGAVASSISAALGFDKSFLRPSLCLDSVFAPGPIDSALESATCVRCYPPLRESHAYVSVPRAAVDWLAAVDDLAIIDDLTRMLKAEPILSKDLTSYLVAPSAKRLNITYADFIRDRQTAFAQKALAEEVLQRIGEGFTLNIFNPERREYAWPIELDSQPKRARYFHRDLWDAFERQGAVLRATTSLLTGREIAIADVLRDSTSWSTTQASNRLATTIVWLTLMLVVLTVLVVPASVIPEDVKSQIWTPISHVFKGVSSHPPQPPALKSSPTKALKPGQ